MMPRIYRGRTPVRNVRVSDEVWFAAMDRAHAEDKDLSEIIRAFLKRYGKAAH